MHESHLREAVEGRKFVIMFCVDSHVEMVMLDEEQGMNYYLTVTAKPGCVIDSMSTVEEIAPNAHSIYLTCRRRRHGDDGDDYRTAETITELELLQPDGSLIPSFRDLGDNIEQLRPLSQMKED